MRSVLVMPIPVSRMVSVLFSLSGTMSILRSLPDSSLDGSDSASYRILSRASEELEISSRRKISLLLGRVSFKRDLSLKIAGTYLYIVLTSKESS